MRRTLLFACCCSIILLTNSAFAQSAPACSLDDQAFQFQCVQECNNMVAPECQSVGLFLNSDVAFGAVETRVPCAAPFKRFRRSVNFEAAKIRFALRGLVYAGLLQRSVISSFNAKVEAHVQACKQQLRDNSAGGGGDENPPPPPPGYGELRLK